MAWQLTPYTLPLLITAVLIFAVGVVAVVRQRNYEPVPGGYVAVGITFAVALALSAYAVQLAIMGREAKLLWHGVQSLFSVPISGLFALTVLRFTNNDRYLNRVTVAALFAVPAVTMLLVVTNQFHDLLWPTVDVVEASGFQVLVTTSGPAYRVFEAYFLLTMGLSIPILVRRAVYTRGIYRRQAVGLTAVALVPISVTALDLVGSSPIAGLDLTVVGIAAVGLGIAWSVARHGLFTLVPVARQTAVGQMDDAVVVVDARGLIVDLNQPAVAFLEDGEGSAVGARVGKVMEPLAVPPSPDPESGYEETEIVTQHRTGRHFQRIVSSLTGPDGAVLGQLIVLRDVTERRQRVQRLRQQNEQLEEFASVVSHDLRNPLNVISARSQLARETGEAEHFDRLEEAADRMDRLIDDLLQLARQGQTVNETTQVDLRTVADDAWSLVEAPEASLEIDGDITVEADRDRLQQAFENLFRNATDHVGEDVGLRVQPLDDGFAVEDDGPGIPDEELDQVFDYGHTTEEDGTGFGLAIVREIVEAHGWEVRAINGDMLATGIDADEPAYGGARFEVTGVTTAQSLSLADVEHSFEFG
jgi:signal transduction histidine kinase